MTYFEVTDFKSGLDGRRLAVKGVPGSLRTLQDAHINRGAEIEKRRAFTDFAELPVGTFGLCALAGQIWVFGENPAPGMPAGVNYQRIPSPGGLSLRRVLSTQLFAGKIFVIAEYDTGAVRHFYDGTMLTNYTLDPSGNIQNARIALPFKGQMTLLYGSSLARSKLNDPTSYNLGDTGAAFYDMSTQTAGSETLTGASEYQEKMAVFSRRNTQLWAFSADPTAAARAQTLSRVGTTSPRSVLSVGGTDVFFIADSGVRSLRIRDALGNASVQDIGTPIDDALTAQLRGLTAAQFEAVFAELEPTTGRYWVTIAGVTYVYSGFASAGISAWSTYALPAGAEAMVIADDRVYVRAGDMVYLYGGTDNDTYDATQVVVELPYIDGHSIATWKRWTGFDMACEGTWQVFASYDPEQPDVEDLITEVTGSTFFGLNEVMAGFGPLVKLRLVSVGTGPAKVSSIVLHYAAAEAK